ncbi:MAG: right-handed parallel beta-helix repeat-containing protein, partial [Nanoarchaeota archaeon]|nr:right-handed parallel beta-helix repeat-containing protein [Nanoarchaeota archaeon]
TVNAGCNVTLTSSHTMTDDLTCANTAFYIGDNNVVLDCAGYTITYGTAGTASTYGIDNNGNYDNITIKNCIIIEGAYGGNDAIFLSDTINSTVHNNTLITVGPSADGIYVGSSGAYNNLTNNTITISGASGRGIYLPASTSNVIGNTIYTNGSSSGFGIDVSSTSNSVIMNNNITTEGVTSFGIRVVLSSGINVSLNEINTTGSGSTAILVSSNSDNNIIHKNNIIHCAEDGIKLLKVFANSPNNNNISENTFGDVDGYDLNVGEATDVTYLIDQAITNYSFFSGGNIIHIENSSAGIIRFLSGVNGSGINLSENIQMSNNYTYINSSKQGLNRSANLTFFSVASITNAIPMRDGIGCPPKICSNVTNSTATTFHFNVTSFSYYSVNHNNTAPPQVTLSSPEDGSSANDRTPTFTWDAAVDPDGSSVTYEINVDNDNDFESCAINESSISDVTYTPGPDLVVDDDHFWRVRAYDGEDYGQWSDTWNFTIDSILMISMINDAIEFGDVNRGTNYDTTADNPIPFSVQNDGNVLINISVNASSLFNSVSMPDSSYRAKADGILQTGQSANFDFGNSTTSWFDMPESELIMAIASLKYQDSNDDAELDILVNAPMDEFKGNKSSETLFSAEALE